MADEEKETQEKKKEDDEQIKKKRLLILLLLLLLGSISVTVWTIWFRKPEVVLAPDFAPQQVEDNAEPIGDGGESKLEQPEGGGAVSLTYSREADIDLSEGKASLLFANPSKSNQDMVLQLIIEDTVIKSSPGGLNRATRSQLSISLTEPKKCSRQEDTRENSQYCSISRTAVRRLC